MLVYQRVVCPIATIAGQRWNELPPGMRPKDAIGNLKALGDLARPARQYLWRGTSLAPGSCWIPKVSKKQLHLQTDLDRMHVKCPTQSMADRQRWILVDVECPRRLCYPLVI